MIELPLTLNILPVPLYSNSLTNLINSSYDGLSTFLRFSNELICSSTGQWDYLCNLFKMFFTTLNLMLIDFGSCLNFVLLDSNFPFNTSFLFIIYFFFWGERGTRTHKTHYTSYYFSRVALHPARCSPFYFLNQYVKELFTWQSYIFYLITSKFLC